jgi:hypothetical protein
VNAVPFGATRVIHGKAVIKEALVLYAKLLRIINNIVAGNRLCVATHMLQAVPLRACLCIDMEFIIEPYKSFRGKVLDCLSQRDTPKAGMVEIGHRPIELDMQPVFYFFGSLPDHFWGKQVQC